MPKGVLNYLIGNFIKKLVYIVYTIVIVRWLRCFKAFTTKAQKNKGFRQGDKHSMEWTSGCWLCWVIKQPKARKVGQDNQCTQHNGHPQSWVHSITLTSMVNDYRTPWNYYTTNIQIRGKKGSSCEHFANVMGMLCEHCGNIMGMWKRKIYINHFCNMQSFNLVHYITNFHIGWQWNITFLFGGLLIIF